MTTDNNIILEQSTDILKGNMSFGDNSINPVAKAAIGDIISREKNNMRNAKISSLVSQQKKIPFEKNTALNVNRQIFNANSQSVNSDGENSPPKEKRLSKRQSTIKDFRQPIEKMIEKFWVNKIENDPEISNHDHDQHVHYFIHQILVMADDDP